MKRLAAHGSAATRRAAVSLGVLGVLVTAGACGGGNAGDARYPARAEGCEVTIFRESPDGPTDNIGPVEASCSDDVSDADCLRTLKDAACKLGGDVVWGVEDTPKKFGDKNRWSGRAAHTRAPRASRTPDAGDAR